MESQLDFDRSNNCFSLASYPISSTKGVKQNTYIIWYYFNGFCFLFVCMDNIYEEPKGKGSKQKEIIYETESTKITSSAVSTGKCQL